MFSAPGLAGPPPPELLANPGLSGAGLGPAPDGGRCEGQPEGASCWVELTDQPGCYVWISHFQPDATVTWTAECAEGSAQGTGTLKEVWDGGRKTKEKTGSLVDGKPQGRWVYRGQDGTVAEGAYEDGERHGHWVERLADGTVMKGPYEAGKRHGHWIERDSDGKVEEGRYVGSMRHGWWVMRKKGLVVDQTYFVDGEGNWEVGRAPR